MQLRLKERPHGILLCSSGCPPLCSSNCHQTCCPSFHLSLWMLRLQECDTTPGGSSGLFNTWAKLDIVARSWRSPWVQELKTSLGYIVRLHLNKVMLYECVRHIQIHIINISKALAWTKGLNFSALHLPCPDWDSVNSMFRVISFSSLHFVLSVNVGTAMLGLWPFPGPLCTVSSEL